MRYVVAGVVLAAMAVAGCEQAPRPGRQALGGALIGATAGALGGLLVGGDDRRNALVGAGIGLLVGAGVGTYLDEQQRQLEQGLDGTGASVTRQGDRLMVSLPESITFDTDSSALKPSSERALDQLSQSLNQYASSYVDVVGHTDDTGSDDYNQALSERRAISVEQGLLQRGVNSARLQIAGAGETQPVADNTTSAGRALNRRVEVYITPATEG